MFENINWTWIFETAFGIRPRSRAEVVVISRSVINELTSYVALIDLVVISATAAVIRSWIIDGILWKLALDLKLYLW